MTTPTAAESSGRWRLPDSWAQRLAAVVLLAFGFVPWPALLDVRLEMPALTTQLRDWLTGSILTLGVGTLTWILSTRAATDSVRLADGRIPEAGRAARNSQPSFPNWRLALIALASFLLYAAIATGIFSRRPLLVDEIAQLWQAQRYAEGRLWIPAPAHREFFSFLHLVDLSDRVYAQFPPGGPGMLWLGVLAGKPWLVGPMMGALCVVLFSRVVRAAEPDGSTRWVTGTTVLFAVTPFAAFMFGSHMNHVTALFWILIAVVGLIELTRAKQPHGIVWAFGLGVGLGVAASIRPLDAFAFALPAAVWLAVRAGRSMARWRENAVAGVGVAVPFAAMMYVNAQTTGHPFQFGYEVLWGAAHGLGFHAAPWGEAHTPVRGFALASLYQWRLQTYLFETPFPSLLLPVAGLWFTRRISSLDRFLLSASGLVVLFYLLYWHDGFFLGPRFLFPLLPALVLWSARVSRVVAQRVGSIHTRRSITAMLVFGAVGAVIFNLPVRIASYRAGLSSMRTDYTHFVAQRGVRDALIFVRESWGAQLMVRLWALGVSRPAAESIYRQTDACHLEGSLAVLERQGVRGLEAERRLAVIAARDSAFVLNSTISPDFTERVRPGVVYSVLCSRRVAEDQAGYLHYAPFQLIRGGNNIYARDLHQRDSLLLAEYPTRPVFLLTRAGTAPTAPLTLLPLRRDSLMAAWQSEP